MLGPQLDPFRLNIIDNEILWKGRKYSKNWQNIFSNFKEVSKLSEYFLTILELKTFKEFLNIIHSNITGEK